MVFAYKRMPYEVIQPIMTMLGWLLWVVLLSCMAWLLVSAARMWMGYRSGDLLDGEATHGVLMSLVGALMATTASGIALALLPS